MLRTLYSNISCGTSVGLKEVQFEDGLHFPQISTSVVLIPKVCLITECLANDLNKATRTIR